MILNKESILREVKFPNGLDKFQVNSHSIDLRVSEIISLKPGAHYIAKTIDVVELPNDIMAIVFPRSSLNRAFVTLDVTGVVDPGYKGQLILPLTAHEEVLIPMGTRIASLIFYRCKPSTEIRESKYQNSDGKLKPDKIEETKFLEAGNVHELKAIYKI